MPLIIGIVLILFVILVVWIWHNLEDLNKTSKIGFIIISILLMLIFTFILYNISKKEIIYESIEIERQIRNNLLPIFVAINGMLIIPFIAKIFIKIREEEIDRESFKKKALILIVIIVLVSVIETGYMKKTQNGILKIYEKTISEQEKGE
jgi:amino acid permease